MTERMTAGHSSKMEQDPERRMYRKDIVFEILDYSELSEMQRAAVDAAIAQQRLSTNNKYRAGAAVVGIDGKLVATHNREEGSRGHAEQLAISDFFAVAKPDKKALMLLALAGSLPGEEVIRQETPYTGSEKFEELKYGRLCGKCLEFMHDVSANVDDVEILTVMATGQVLRTTLRSLITDPHTSANVPYNYNRNAPQYGYQPRPTDHKQHIAELGRLVDNLNFDTNGK